MVVPDDVWIAALKRDLDPVRGWFASGDRDANDRDREGFTLLYRAFQSNMEGAPEEFQAKRLAIARFLIAQGADVNFQAQATRVDDGLHNLTVTIVNDLTLLHMSLSLWKASEVDMLLQLGADVTLKRLSRPRDSDHSIRDHVTPLEFAFSRYHLGLFSTFNARVLESMLRAGASLDFSSNGLSPEARLLNVIEDAKLEAQFVLANVDERVRELDAGRTLIRAVRQEGSYRAYLRRPHKALLRIRSLRARGRARAIDATPPHVARLLDPSLPNEIAWGILTYYCDAG